MGDCIVLGIDLAKDVFQLHGEDRMGNRVISKRLSRAKLTSFMRQLPVCDVGMEACGSAHYWGRTLTEMGHRVKLINPREVKAFVFRNKNDAKDAEAICDATKSPKVRCIPIKTIQQQDITLLHRARSQVVKRRTQLRNHLRSQLSEYGVVARPGAAPLRRKVVDILGGEHVQFSCKSSWFVIADLYEEWQTLDARIARYDNEINNLANTDIPSKRLMALPGFGKITATAVVGKVQDIHSFRRGRDFSAWLGLTPKEYASGNKRYLGGISKQGDRYLRTLMIHGARSVIQATLLYNKQDTPYHRWIHEVVARVGKNKAAVALANKHARMAWAVLFHDREVDLNFAYQFQSEEEQPQPVSQEAIQSKEQQHGI